MLLNRIYGLYIERKNEKPRAQFSFILISYVVEESHVNVCEMIVSPWVATCCGGYMGFKVFLVVGLFRSYGNASSDMEQ